MKTFINNIITRVFPENLQKQIFAYYRVLKFKFRKTLPCIEFHIAEHCNLNCAGCDHFSPLAAEEYADIDIVKRDMEKLSKLTGGKLKQIRLIGGEPLLHKEITAFFPLVRKCFSSSTILLFTNGILLKKHPETFWEACKKSNITLFVTRYPINIDADYIEAKCKEYGLQFLHPPGVRDEEMYRCVLSMEGTGNAKQNWMHCMHNWWTFLHNGRIYPCPFYANIRHFNKFFGKDLPLTEKDSIDIHKVKNLKEILRFLSKPIPACKYCDISAYTCGHKWAVSKKDISEWT